MFDKTLKFKQTTKLQVSLTLVTGYRNKSCYLSSRGWNSAPKIFWLLQGGHRKYKIQFVGFSEENYEKNNMSVITLGIPKLNSVALQRPAQAVAAET